MNWKDKPAWPLPESSESHAVRTWLAGQAITAASNIKMPITEEYIQNVIIKYKENESAMRHKAAMKYEAEFIATMSVQIADAILAELEKAE